MHIGRCIRKDTTQSECWTSERWAVLTDQPPEPSLKLEHNNGRPAEPKHIEDEWEHNMLRKIFIQERFLKIKYTHLKREIKPQQIVGKAVTRYVHSIQFNSTCQGLVPSAVPQSTLNLQQEAGPQDKSSWAQL